MKKQLSTLLGIISATSFYGCASVHREVEEKEEVRTSRTTEHPMSQARMTDEVILNDLHHVNQREMDLAELALEKSADSDVRAFATQMMKDHREMEGNVMEVAKAKDIQLPSFQMSTSEKATMSRLEGLQGKAFDLAFMQDVYKGHKEVAQELNLARSEVKDGMVLSLIDQTIPKINHHKQLAGVLQKNLSDQAGVSTPG